MGSALSAERSDQFFFDRRTQEWRWHYGGQWWTYEVMYDDLDTGILRAEGRWVSDRGECWYGTDPQRWQRDYERRLERQRRWIDRQRRYRAEVVRCNLVRKALEQKMPGPLAQLALEQAFGWDIVVQNAGGGK